MEMVCHYILWYEHYYTKGWAKALRDHWYCRIVIPHNTLHREIHANVSHIPVPRVSTIKDALFQLQLLEKFGGISPNDNFDKRLMVLMAIFDCAEPATYDALKKQHDIVCKFYFNDPR